MNSKFPLDLYDRLDPARGEPVCLQREDAERLRAFLRGMNSLDLLMREVPWERLETDDPALRKLAAVMTQKEAL